MAFGNRIRGYFLVFHKQELAWGVIIYTICIQIQFFIRKSLAKRIFWKKKRTEKRTKIVSTYTVQQACVFKFKSDWLVWVCVCVSCAFFFVSLSFRFLLHLRLSCLSHTHLLSQPIKYPKYESFARSAATISNAKSEFGGISIFVYSCLSDIW